MADKDIHAETLAEFKDSFFYGSRSNLSVVRDTDAVVSDLRT